MVILRKILIISAAGGDYEGIHISRERNICGDRIRLARLAKRFSQSDLCRQLQLIGIPMERDSISRIESGSRYVADYEVTTIADILEVSVLWLLGRE